LNKQGVKAIRETDFHKKMKSFYYNIRSEVTGATMGSDNYNYNYDPIGNREWNQLNGSTNTYTANQLNQYAAITGGVSASPTHDADGNLTFDGSWFYAWDAENRLISASNLTSGVYCEYAYDYQSRRISKTTLTPNPFSSLTSIYIWDGYNIAAEIIIDHVTPMTNISYYTWGLDLSGTLQGAGGVGGLLAETKTTSTGTNTYYTLGDANGNITEYVNESGATVAHGEHNAFGETKRSGLMKNEFTHWFSTKPFDAETSLVVYQRRYYDPILGRWLSMDPIEEEGGVNLYGFVGNDGVNKWDYLGLTYGTHLTKQEACKLKCAIKFWLIDASVAMPFTSGVYHRPISLRFLKNYISMSGAAQRIDGEVMAGDASIKSLNLQAVKYFQTHKKESFLKLSTQATGDDLNTAVQRIVVQYEDYKHSKMVKAHLPTETYTFLDTGEDEGKGADLLFLGFEGSLCGWKGGSFISDKWLGDLEKYNYAKSFRVYSSWTVSYLLP